MRKAPVNQSGLTVIEPGGFLSHSATRTITLPEENVKSYDAWRYSMPFRELSQRTELWFSIIVEVWPGNLNRAGGGNRFGKRVLKRRSPEGDLILETLTSEPVRFTLRSGEN